MAQLGVLCISNLCATKPIQSKTKSYRLFYRIMKPFFPIFKFVVPNSILTTQSIGIAMLNAVRRGYSTNILDVKDIVKLSNNVE